MKRAILNLVAIVAVISIVNQLYAEDYFVSATRGKGKKASKEKPAKDLGNITSKLKPGDTIHIAAGKYTGRGDCGTVLVTVPVNIIGGYNDEFTARDPWGKYKTIFTGINKSDNWKREPALFVDLMKYRQKEMPAILIDGIIVDHADRNRYGSDKQVKIIRSANPKTKQNPTPDQGGLVVRAGKSGDLNGKWNITVQNCIVINTAPSQGALSVAGYKGSMINIKNNLVMNNTGTGIMCSTKYAGSDESLAPQFLVENNTVLFSWKYDPSAQSYSGNSIKFDNGVIAKLQNNVFAFADKIGINNISKAKLLVKENLILGNVQADYLEFDTKMSLDDIEDEAEFLHEDSTDNIQEKISLPVDKEWAKNYASRVLVDRNAAEADIKAQKTSANEIRSILGLPLRAGTVDGPTSAIWLNRVKIDDAIKCGSKPYKEKYGCKMPKFE
jgi:hypothetical protein